MRNGGFVPWTSWSEWFAVADSIFSSDERKVSYALDKISSWSQSGSLPLALDVTSCLKQIELLSQEIGSHETYEFKNNDLSILNQKRNGQAHFQHGDQHDNKLVARNRRFDRETSQYRCSELCIRQLCCMGILRLVNGLAEQEQKGREYATSVSALVTQHGISRLLIDTRHQGSHQQLPTMSTLHVAKYEALSWLYDNYWHPQRDRLHVYLDTLQQCIDDYLRYLCHFCTVSITQEQGLAQPPNALLDAIRSFCGADKQVACHLILQALLHVPNQCTVATNNTTHVDGTVGPHVAADVAWRVTRTFIVSMAPSLPDLPRQMLSSCMAQACMHVQISAKRYAQHFCWCSAYANEDNQHSRQSMRSTESQHSQRVADERFGKQHIGGTGERGDTSTLMSQQQDQSTSISHSFTMRSPLASLDVLAWLTYVIIGDAASAGLRDISNHEQNGSVEQSGTWQESVLPTTRSGSKADHALRATRVVFAQTEAIEQLWWGGGGCRDNEPTTLRVPGCNEELVQFDSDSDAQLNKGAGGQQVQVPFAFQGKQQRMTGAKRKKVGAGKGNLAMESAPRKRARALSVRRQESYWNLEWLLNMANAVLQLLICCYSEKQRLSGGSTKHHVGTARGSALSCPRCRQYKAEVQEYHSIVTGLLQRIVQYLQYQLEEECSNRAGDADCLLHSNHVLGRVRDVLYLHVQVVGTADQTGQHHPAQPFVKKSDQGAHGHQKHEQNTHAARDENLCDNDTDELDEVITELGEEHLKQKTQMESIKKRLRKLLQPDVPTDAKGQPIQNGCSSAEESPNPDTATNQRGRHKQHTDQCDDSSAKWHMQCGERYFRNIQECYARVVLIAPNSVGHVHGDQSTPGSTDLNYQQHAQFGGHVAAGGHTNDTLAVESNQYNSMAGLKASISYHGTDTITETAGLEQDGTGTLCDAWWNELMMCTDSF